MKNNSYRPAEWSSLRDFRVNLCASHILDLQREAFVRPCYRRADRRVCGGPYLGLYREFLQANTEKSAKRHSGRPSERTVDKGMYVDI